MRRVPLIECQAENSCHLDAVAYCGSIKVCSKHYARWKRTGLLHAPPVHRRLRTDNLTTVGKNITAIRAQRKLKVLNLCNIAGVDSTMLRNLCRNKDFKISSLEKLAKGLDVEAWTLLCPGYYKMPGDPDALD